MIIFYVLMMFIFAGFTGYMLAEARESKHPGAWAVFVLNALATVGFFVAFAVESYPR